MAGLSWLSCWKLRRTMSAGLRDVSMVIWKRCTVLTFLTHSRVKKSSSLGTSRRSTNSITRKSLIVCRLCKSAFVCGGVDQLYINYTCFHPLWLADNYWFTRVWLLGNDYLVLIDSKCLVFIQFTVQLTSKTTITTNHYSCTVCQLSLQLPHSAWCHFVHATLLLGLTEILVASRHFKNIHYSTLHVQLYVSFFKTYKKCVVFKCSLTIKKACVRVRTNTSNIPQPFDSYYGGQHRNPYSQPPLPY